MDPPIRIQGLKPFSLLLQPHMPGFNVQELPKLAMPSRQAEESVMEAKQGEKHGVEVYFPLVIVDDGRFAC